MKPTRMFESAGERAGFLRFWGYAAVLIGIVNVALVVVWLVLRR